MTGWSDFYVIVGSAAAALTGLQFVVIVLSAEARMGSMNTTRAFATPTVVHFCAVLLVAAVVTAPWPAPLQVSAIAVAGSAGVVYVILTALRARQQHEYVPVFEDWLWHTVVPMVGYAGLVSAAPLHRSREVLMPSAVAIASLVLLFTGIHNAWDSVIFVAHGQREHAKQGKST